MEPNQSLPPSRDKLLFTPGPLSTSGSVKSAMLHDAGSWHFEFSALVQSVRQRILAIAGLTPGAGYEVVLMQGSGTFGVEAVFATCVPPQGHVAVLSNGAYGERMGQMLQCLRIPHTMLRTPEDTPNDPAALEALLAADAGITHVAMVHSETTTGILNPVAEVGAVVRRHRRSFIVDAMSSFGAIPLALPEIGIDYLVSSANKCIEGVPGFSFVLARSAALRGCEGFARSLSLDLLAQTKGFDKNGQFRYTPPTHSILAFDQALRELEQEGGVAGRAQRYARNHETLVRGMQALGFRVYLRPAVQSFIITSFHFPADPKFTFDAFYRNLSERGFIIYPGKISQADTFRIGSIGRLFPSDMLGLVAAVRDVIAQMGIEHVTSPAQGRPTRALTPPQAGLPVTAKP